MLVNEIPIKATETETQSSDSGWKPNFWQRKLDEVGAGDFPFQRTAR